MAVASIEIVMPSMVWNLYVFPVSLLPLFHAATCKSAIFLQELLRVCGEKLV